MKLLTLNFLTCAIKTCKTQPSSFPLHPRDAELEIQEADVNLPFLRTILPRLMWEEIRVIAGEVRFLSLLHHILFSAVYFYLYIHSYFAVLVLKSIPVLAKLAVTVLIRF